MKSEKVLEPFGLQEFYVDGFGNFHLSNGILRCAAFTQQPAPGAIEAATSALGNNSATLHVLK